MSKSNETTEISHRTPAYVAFPTFENFITRLHAAQAIPPRIDKRMMDYLSGGVQGHLFSALRFLGLVEGKHSEVTPAMEKLIESCNTDGYKDTLKAILEDAYSDVIGEMDIAKANAKQLDDAFALRKLDGVMRDRAVRFYLKALGTAGVAVSPYLGKRKPRGSNGSQKPRKPRTEKTGTSELDETLKPKLDQLPKGLVEFPIPIGTVSGACIRVPVGITMKEIPLVRAIFGAVEALAKQNSGEE